MSVREDWLIARPAPAADGHEDLFPNDRLRKAQVRHLRETIRERTGSAIILLPSHRPGGAELPRTKAESTDSGTVRTVTPIVLDELPSHHFLPVVLPENLRDPMGNFMIHVSGRQLLVFFFALVFSGAGLFAAGFFLHRAAASPLAVSSPAPITRSASPPPAHTSARVPTQERAARTGRTKPATTASSGARGAASSKRSAGSNGKTETGGAKGTVIQVGDIPVYVQ